VITEAPTTHAAVLHEALTGLSRQQKTLSPWLFYDELGSQLFERITDLPEYYLTRTERALFADYAQDIFNQLAAPVTLAELGAGSASKTGILLRAATHLQPEVLYQPIDISPTALAEAAASITGNIPGVRVEPQTANYITEPYSIARLPQHKVLALYIGSSIGNFAPAEAHSILRNLRERLHPGDALLLGVDLAPSTTKPVATLLAAYDDAQGVTATFNKNVLTRLNRELDADFNLDAFTHRARWNGPCSRIEMHLESLADQTVHIAGNSFHFRTGETIHTENSHKFTPAALETLLTSAGFTPTRAFHSPGDTFAVTLATAV
jgi:dimethylhistidine N-methyltransferase